MPYCPNCHYWMRGKKQMGLLAAELWARDIQLWLNQVEGLLAEKLPKLNRSNGQILQDEMRRLMVSGHQLQHKGETFEELGPVPARARQVLEKCLATAPELEERIKDARVLAAVRRGPELPPELTESSTWLHWLKEAIPTIELLPVEFTEDEEFLAVQTELRLLRDGVKYPQSLDHPAQTMDRSGVTE